VTWVGQQWTLLGGRARRSRRQRRRRRPTRMAGLRAFDSYLRQDGGGASNMLRQRIEHSQYQNTS
jgi:hypothetical protein